MRNISDADQGNPMFGADDSDKLEIESDKNMQVPQLDFASSDENASHLRGLVDPLEDYGDHGVGNFLQVVEFASILDS